MTPNLPTPQHAAFAAFTGTWSGTTKLYFEPGVLHSEDPIAASVHVVSGGYALLFGYVGAHGDERTHGTMLVSYDAAADRHSVAWVDTFHSRSMMGLSGDRAPEGTVRVEGTYEAEGQTWGWQIALSVEASNAIALRMYNVIPGEAPALAVETLLTREHLGN